MSNNISNLLEESKLGVQIGEGYANRSYNIFYFTLLVYAGILILPVGADGIIQQQMIYFLFLPVVSYVLGLFYIYNSYVITRQSYYMIRIDILVRLSYYKTYKEKSDYQGWNIFSKYYDGHYILVYGTALIFYFAIPLFDFLYGLSLRNWNLYSDFTKIKTWNILITFFPFILYLCFLIFSILIILRTISLYRDMMRNGVSYEINGTKFIARIKFKR